MVVCYPNKYDTNESLINKFIKKCKQSPILREYKEKQEFIPNNEKRRKRKMDRDKKIKEKHRKNNETFTYFDSHKIQNNSNVNKKYFDKFFEEDILFDMPCDENNEVDTEKFNLIVSTYKSNNNNKNKEKQQSDQQKTKQNNNFKQNNQKNNNFNSKEKGFNNKQNKQFNNNKTFNKNNQNNFKNNKNFNNKKFDNNNQKNKYKIIDGGKNK